LLLCDLGEFQGFCRRAAAGAPCYGHEKRAQAGEAVETGEEVLGSGGGFRGEEFEGEVG